MNQVLDDVVKACDPVWCEGRGGFSAAGRDFDRRDGAISEVGREALGGGTSAEITFDRILLFSSADGLRDQTYTFLFPPLPERPLLWCC